MPMKVKITIMGERVHDIGYRYYLMENALAFGIERFRAINVVKDRQVVEVFIEGEEDSVKEFCEFVKVNFPPDAIVDDVKIEDYKGYVPKIEAFALVFNIGQSRKFIEEAKGVKGALVEIKEDITEIKNDMSEIKDGIVSIERGLMDVKNTIKEESEKTRQYLGAKIDESTKTICNKIDDLRYDLRAYLDERLKKLEEEIKEIKAKIGMS
jgi:acylphosphatase